MDVEVIRGLGFEDDTFSNTRFDSAVLPQTRTVSKQQITASQTQWLNFYVFEVERARYRRAGSCLGRGNPPHFSALVIHI